MSGAIKDETSWLLDFLRHGEPVGGRRYRGQMDDPLSEKGWAEMVRATAGDRPWTGLVTSPLSRCHAFAEHLARETGLPLALEPRFKEVGFGAWEGRTSDELNALEPGCVFDFKRDPVACRPAGAEPLADFYRRVSEGFETLLEGASGRHPLVIAHAGVMRMVLCHVLGLAPSHAYRLQIASAARMRIRVEVRGSQRHAALLYLGDRP